MTSFVRTLFFILVVNGFVFVVGDALLSPYVSLITDVHKYYGTSSVFFAFSQSDRSLQELTLIHSLCRTFSKKGVLTLMLRFANLHRRSDWYRRHIVRPLVVVVLKTVSDIDEFRAKTRAMNKSYPIWLVLFADESNEKLCDHCDHPQGNILGIRYDTEMLVVCCHNPILKEWWSINGTRTEVSNFAIKPQNEKLTVLGETGLYARRHTLNGTGLRVALVAQSALVTDNGKDIDGFIGTILTELIRVMNFTISRTVREEVFGSYNATSKDWSGAIGLLARSEVDLGVSEFAMTNRRLDAIDFSLPLLLSRSKLYVKEPSGSRLNWTAYLKAFNVEIWFIMIVLLITTPLLLTAINMMKNSIPLSWTLGENYLHVWGIFCQQGLSEFPAETPLRIAFFSIYLSALVISAAYSGALISFLAVRSVNLPFYDMEAFAKDGSYKLIVYQNSAEYDFFATSNDSVLMKMMTLMKPPKDLPQTLEEGFRQVCNERVAFYTNEAMKQTIDTSLECKIASIPTGRTETLAITLPARSQYTGILNYHFHRFRDNGMIKRLKQRYFIKPNPEREAHYGVGIRGAAPVLSVLTGGILLAFLLFILEKIYYSASQNI